MFFFFFFQAEDGIRDPLVTGVQTCALPILARSLRFSKKTLAKVLAFVAVSAVFTAVLASKIGNLEFFQHDYQLSAVFSDAAGVSKGDAVKLAGVDVGRVSAAHIADGHGVVDFT